MLRPLTKHEAEHLVKAHNKTSYLKSYWRKTRAGEYQVCCTSKDGLWLYSERDQDLIKKDDWTIGGWSHKRVTSFDFEDCPMAEPDFDLEDIELAEIIVAELEGR